MSFHFAEPTFHEGHASSDGRHDPLVVRLAKLLCESIADIELFVSRGGIGELDQPKEPEDVPFECQGSIA